MKTSWEAPIAKELRYTENSGATPSKRASSIKLEYERVTTVLGKRWWGAVKILTLKPTHFIKVL